MMMNEGCKFIKGKGCEDGGEKLRPCAKTFPEYRTFANLGPPFNLTVNNDYLHSTKVLSNVRSEDSHGRAMRLTNLDFYYQG